MFHYSQDIFVRDFDLRERVYQKRVAASPYPPLVYAVIVGDRPLSWEVGDSTLGHFRVMSEFGMSRMSA